MDKLKKRKLTTVSVMHYIRLVLRSSAFIALLVLYILHHTRGGQMFAVEICPYNTAGRHIQDVRFQHIRFLGDAGQLPPSTIKGLDAQRRVVGVTLQHVTINRETITSHNLPRFVQTNEYATGVQVKSK